MQPDLHTESESGAWVLLHQDVQQPIGGDLDLNAEKYLMLLSGGVAG